MNYQKSNNFIGWLCGVMATATYVLTMEPTASWWDTGEFIAAAYRMQIVHQPGAPLFLMLQNLFANLAMGNPARIAYWMNFGSALTSGLTIVFLFWTITALVRKLVCKPGSAPASVQLAQIMGAGFVGAMAYAFTDSFWFSAVESEVYAWSSLCTAVVFWAILKWEARADEQGADRWLVLIAYIMGLSIGVHLLNLLTIPVLALVVYFRRTSRATVGGATKALLVGCAILAFILWGVIQYMVKFAAYTDLFFVNTLGLGFGAGAVAFAVLLIGSIAYGIWYAIRKVKPLLHIALVCLGFIVFGYGSFAMVLIRANAHPSLNNSAPDDMFSFLWYLNRGQFGSEPLVNGPFFDSKVVDIERGPNEYRKGMAKYELAGTADRAVHDRTTLFPRVYSNRDSHPFAYRLWLGLGEGEQPRFAENLKFLFTYQFGHMYWRYFLWNFAGRQNDMEARFAGRTEGNWASGITPIDQLRLGGQAALPQAARSDPSRNTYYFLPLALGLIGLVWQVRRSRKDAAVIGLLFFFTGLAIVLYLNQSPLQPRERDYAYVGSFYAFAIWIGMGVVGLAEALRTRFRTRMAVPVAMVVSCMVAPVLLGYQNWDDHDRSDRYMARDMARNYLESCAPNAILFTYIDNDTFPLWYLQEVEGVRTDVRVINLSLLGMDWAVDQLKFPVNDAPALPLTIEDRQYVKGTRDYLYYHDYGIQDSVELQKILALLLSDNPADQLQYADGSSRNFLPTKRFQLAVDRQQVVANDVVPSAWQDRVVDTMEWTYNQDIVTRAELVMMDVLVHNNWERPVYFAFTVPESQRLGLEDYLVSEGFALRLMPVNAGSGGEAHARLVNTEATYGAIMHKYRWGNMNDATYLDPTSRGMVGETVKVFSDTAEMLIAEGNTEAARDIVNRAVTVLPTHIGHVDIAVRYPVLADQLYALGETDKANVLVDRNQRFLAEQLAYYADIAETHRLGRSEEMGISNSLYALQQFAHATAMRGEEKRYQQLQSLFDNYRQLFFGGQS
ncbi:protein O-mannosyl-transferase family [Parapedobacter sp. 2B3]|uniref:protein O-mannosyl-transferase family n=1 Tax=Parapedobacter sp. 2B3 TaxID=3342381 RepID=UPI0035B5F012